MGDFQLMKQDLVGLSQPLVARLGVLQLALKAFDVHVEANLKVGRNLLHIAQLHGADRQFASNAE